MAAGMRQPVFRFAPSPNGYLHLGHAYSALLNQALAAREHGRLLLRIENIDSTRCKPEFEVAIEDDLAWLGVSWEAPVLRQSDEMGSYGEALDRLAARALVYPCFCSRQDIAGAVAARERGGHAVRRDPDRQPHYPGTCRRLAEGEAERRVAAGEPHALRLDMPAALQSVQLSLTWTEIAPFDRSASRTVEADPGQWGDVVLARKEFRSSYHLAVVMDDHRQAISDVVRGLDMQPATHVHRLLQAILEIEPPAYSHHPLLISPTGEKLSKSRGSISLRQLRTEGAKPADIRATLGLPFSFQ